MHLDDNLSQIDFTTWRQISKSLFTLIFPQMLKQLMKNAEDLENLDKLLDSSNKSYSDSKSKKSSLEINFLFRYGQFCSGTVFFATPCIYPCHQATIRGMFTTYFCASVSYTLLGCSWPQTKESKLSLTFFSDILCTMMPSW